ncbi:MAG: MarR family transcriptional regulator [Dehalococcoidaceae bacterium]|nr:MarR family transcriptional regulator [Dehalococcoidaceae bacterium]
MLLEEDRSALVSQILNASNEIFKLIKPRIPFEYLSSDITVAQLRLLIVLYCDGPSTMGSVASQLNIAMPSATGIMDNLVKKGLAGRSIDGKDRRRVICRLTPAGTELINRLWIMGEEQMKGLLDGLADEDLEKSAEVARLLLRNITGNHHKPEAANGDKNI